MACSSTDTSSQATAQTEHHEHQSWQWPTEVSPKPSMLAPKHRQSRANSHPKQTGQAEHHQRQSQNRMPSFITSSHTKGNGPPVLVGCFFCQEMVSGQGRQLLIQDPCECESMHLHGKP